MTTIAVGSVFAQDSSSTHLAVLDVLEGEWEGTATAYFPRSKDRPPREETVTVVSRKVLKNTYIQFHSKWTQPTGETRELFTFWTYSSEKKNYEIMFLYDDWPDKVIIPLSYNESLKLFTGFTDFVTPKGIPAKERVEWHISADGNEITGLEFNNYQTDPEDYWPMTFKFVWRRKA